MLSRKPLFSQVSTPSSSSCFITTSLEEAATSNNYREDFYFTVDTFEHRCYFNASNENCYFDVDIFEDGVYFI